MKKIVLITIGITAFVVLTLLILGSVSTKISSNNNEAGINGHAVSEEAEGKIVWEKLQAKQVNCPDLSNDDFEVLGEYFMGQMAGSSHEAMNTMMEQMMGKEGEEQIHVAMGKRLSGCDTSAALPPQSVGFMPMIQMMEGANIIGGNMMNFGFTPFGWFGWIFMILWWALIIFGIVALIRWAAGQSGYDRQLDHEKSPLEILKERYAKSEIDKEEFEDKKKDLS